MLSANRACDGGVDGDGVMLSAKRACAECGRGGDGGYDVTSSDVGFDVMVMVMVMVKMLSANRACKQ